MAHTYTLTTLKQAIVRWLEDDSDELAESLDNIIKLAESQLLKDLSFSIFDEVTTGNIISSTLTKPTGLVSIVDLFVTVAGQQQIVEPKPWSYVQLYSGAGTPLYFAETDEGGITVSPAPTSIPYTLRYIKRPESLVDAPTDTTTWLSENVAEVLFWGCIVSSEFFRKADERIAAAKDYYMAAKDSAKVELRHLLRREYA